MLSTKKLFVLFLSALMVFGNKIFFYLWIQLRWSAFLCATGSTSSTSSFFHKALGSFFQKYALPPLYDLVIKNIIFSCCFRIPQSVFSHIQYNIKLVLCAIVFEFLSLFCHKNIHPKSV